MAPDTSRGSSLCLGSSSNIWDLWDLVFSLNGSQISEPGLLVSPMISGLVADWKNVEAGALLVLTALLLDIDWSQWAVTWTVGLPDTGQYFPQLLYFPRTEYVVLQIFMEKYQHFSIWRNLGKLECPFLSYFIFLEKSFKISSTNFTNSMSINI